MGVICTCHPDDDPPRPCPGKGALTECREAARLRVKRYRVNRFLLGGVSLRAMIAARPAGIFLTPWQMAAREIDRGFRQTRKG